MVRNVEASECFRLGYHIWRTYVALQRELGSECATDTHVCRMPYGCRFAGYRGMFMERPVLHFGLSRIRVNRIKAAEPEEGNDVYP